MVQDHALREAGDGCNNIYVGAKGSSCDGHWPESDFDARRIPPCGSLIGVVYQVLQVLVDLNADWQKSRVSPDRLRYWSQLGRQRLRTNKIAG
jgi:hypothetical protein